MLEKSAMTTPARIRTFQYVNRAYDRVRATLHQKEGSLFQAATRAASTRANDLASTLRVSVQGFEVGVDVTIKVFEVKDEIAVGLNSPITRVRLGWEAVRATGLFPHMEATLSAWPLSADETQLEIEGQYVPPMGSVGKALDSLVFHRVAEAAVHRFLEDVVEQLRKELRLL